MAYTKYKEIKYAADGIPGENLTDFPKLISITADADIASELASGGGVKFTSADGSTDLSFGLYPETNLASGTILARVKLTLLTAASVGDVLCRLYYSASETTTEDKAGTVGNGYDLFMPLEDDPSGSAPQMFDWVTETKLGTSQGSMTSTDLVAGQVGKGLEFDGSDDAIAIASAPSYANLEAWTAEIIFRLNSTANFEFVICDSDSANALRVQGDTTLAFVTVGAATKTFTVPSVGTSTHAMAFNANSGSIRAFLDGIESSSGAQSTTTSFVPNVLTESSRFDGLLDELRISSVARSENWLAFAYDDDFNNDDTFTLGAEQGAGGTSTATTRRYSLTLTGVG